MPLDRLTGLFRRTSNGGSFQPSADYDISGEWNFQRGFGFRQRIIASPAQTFNIPKGLSGSIMLFDRPLGGIYILPRAEPELVFDFLISVSLTGGTYEIQTGVPGVFIQGNVVVGVANTTPSAGTGPKVFVADGVTPNRLVMNGGSGGGFRGTRLRAICLTPTLWNIDGTIYGTGAITTPWLP